MIGLIHSALDGTNVVNAAAIATQTPNIAPSTPTIPPITAPELRRGAEDPRWLP